MTHEEEEEVKQEGVSVCRRTVGRLEVVETRCGGHRVRFSAAEGLVGRVVAVARGEQVLPAVLLLLLLAEEG